MGTFSVGRMVSGKDAREHYRMKEGLQGFPKRQHQAHRDSTGIQGTQNICADLDKQNQWILQLFLQIGIKSISELNNEIQFLQEHRISDSPSEQEHWERTAM